MNKSEKKENKEKKIKRNEQKKYEKQTKDETHQEISRQNEKLEIHFHRYRQLPNAFPSPYQYMATRFLL